MARTKTQHKIPLSLLFRVPAGAEQNFVLTDAPSPLAESDTEPPADSTVAAPVEPNESAGYLPSPNTFEVIDQKLRRAPGGINTVDAIIEVEDVMGAIEYEVQVTLV